MIDDMGIEDIHRFLDKRSKAIREVQACWKVLTLLCLGDTQKICTSELARSGQNHGVGCPLVQYVHLSLVHCNGWAYFYVRFLCLWKRRRALWSSPVLSGEALRECLLVD